MVNTDPPYGVSYQSSSGKFDAIENDDLTQDDLMNKLLIPALRNCVRNARDDAAFYIWHASSTRRDFDDAMVSVGLLEKQYIIWVKNAPVLGHADYQWAHEPCYYAEKAGHSAKWCGDRKQNTAWKVTLRDNDGMATTLSGGLVVTDGAGNKVFMAEKPPKGKKIRYLRLSDGRSVTIYTEHQTNTVWEVAREAGAKHPTQKPVELAVRAIENSSELGDIVGRILQLGAHRIMAHAPVPVLFDIRGIHHEHVLFRLVMIDDQVIHDTALFVRETRILRLAERKVGSVVRCNCLDEFQCLRSFYPELAHVRDVEHAHAVYYGHVFVDDSGIFNRHIIAGKLVHLSA